MSSIVALMASSKGLVGAFTNRAQLSRHASRGVTMARSMSTGPMPYEDEKMPFYALGVNLAKQVGGQTGFNSLLEEDELNILLDGFSQTLLGTATQDASTVLETYGNELNKIITERSDNIAARTTKEGEEFISNFLDCNEEAIKTDSGMVYYSMKEGEGEMPTTANTVEVHYHGTLIDGTVFDSSVDRGQTIKFPLGGVIKGWQEGLAMMKEGGKATLIIPADLGYGDAGSGDTIKPGATLKFEVELFKIE
eukprot:CAMPEP_0197831282 /NCGR_PEP_ID=MMETSP1437-20131217/8941_1 /TAXON_ID=49252 ORGANISM="Eucampia antarctica, Strain CCMP1452" /NCGR_SAMPLE_ID=MMETSP1437 /ASSEMBLY_ACC=CAM_ASM_001096 /LENGTH=250 /DNA_ID=CAMNT_0043434137 /DNA_START=58 /DNA_END=810 /DNA_ORIENTATION=+